MKKWHSNSLQKNTNHYSPEVYNDPAIEFVPKQKHPGSALSSGHRMERLQEGL